MTYKNTIQTKKNKVRMTNIQTRERDKLYRGVGYEGRGGRRVYLKSENHPTTLWQDLMWKIDVY